TAIHRLAAARSHRGSESHLGFHSLPRCRFATRSERLGVRLVNFRLSYKDVIRLLFKIPKKTIDLRHEMCYTESNANVRQIWNGLNPTVYNKGEHYEQKNLEITRK
ncbi:MAG: hypothetical protein IKM00_09750, partial [Clostridia bacterium]|nr:hypothetical protein [Clostridia bacterium]